MPDVIKVNDKLYTIGFSKENKAKEIFDLIENNMGNEFARYVDDYIEELKNK